jgi:hypothetical protein
MVQFADPARFSSPVVSGEQNVVRLDTRGAAGDGGAGLLKAGASLLGDITNNIKTKEDADRQNRLDNADVEAAIILNSEANNYNDDPDYTTIGERSGKSINEKINKIAEGITIPRDREIFIQNQKLNIAKTQEHLKGVAFTKERDHSRATVDTQLAELRNVALTGDMGQASELVSRRLESAVAKGYFGAEEAAAIKAQWQTSAASGRLSMMPPESQLEALKSPWAEKLPVDERARLEKGAREQLRVGRAQTISDGLVNKGASLDEGMIHIQKTIKDPEDRKAAEERFKMDYQVRKQAEQDNQDELHNKYAIAVDEGLSIDELKTKHSGEWEKLRPSQRENLKNMASQRLSPPPTSDPAALARVIELSANGRHDDVVKLVTNNSSAFSKEDREQYLTLAAKGKSATAVTDQQLLAGKVLGNDKKSQRDQMLLTMNQWRNDFVKSYGKDPTPEQAEKQVDMLLMKHDKDPSSWGFGDTKEVWKFERDQQIKALEAVHRQELKDEDPENYTATEEYAKARGLKLDRYQFEDTYKSQKLVTSIKRQDPVGYSDVMEYFNPGRDLPNAGAEVVPSHSEILRAYNMILERRNAVK